MDLAELCFKTYEIKHCHSFKGFRQICSNVTVMPCGYRGSYFSTLKKEPTLITVYCKHFIGRHSSYLSFVHRRAVLSLDADRIWPAWSGDGMISLTSASCPYIVQAYRYPKFDVMPMAVALTLVVVTKIRRNKTQLIKDLPDVCCLPTVSIIA